MKYPLNVLRQYILPQHALSRFAGVISQCKIPWLKTYLIHWFTQRYNVNLNEAMTTDEKAYSSFHDFFTRQLKPDVRPIDRRPEVICSPCDGTTSQIGKIEEGSLLQAKGHTFTATSLLGNAQEAKLFERGHYVTIYLAPKDYHRVHMPLAGSLQNLRYIPGKLFSVNPITTQHIPNLFARNERVVALFKRATGSFAIILVGAMIVGSIHTRWGSYLARDGKEIKQINNFDGSLPSSKLDKGEEMGYFSLGSTVIVLLAENMCWEYDVSQNTRLVVGQKIGHLLL